MYSVEFISDALNDLLQLDRAVAQRVLKKLHWLAENFDDIVPEMLTGEWHGKFKLKVGDYRVIYTVNFEERRLTIHLIGHKKDIYKTT